MYKDKRVEKKKTVVMKRCLNPVFNESFAFDIPTERLRETTIVITVMDKDRLSRNDVIGKVGPAAGGDPSNVSCRGVAAGGQPGPCLMATGAISSWRGRSSVAGTLRAGFPRPSPVPAAVCGGEDSPRTSRETMRWPQSSVAMPCAFHHAMLRHSLHRGELQPAKSLFIARQKSKCLTAPVCRGSR